MQWLVTLRCELACPHGLAADDGSGGTELSLDEALDLVDQLADAGVPEALLTGGEPLLRRDLPRILDRIGAQGVPYSPNTAVLPRGEARPALERHAPGFVAVSLDRPRETHDRFRGRPGAFDEALESTEALLDGPPPERRAPATRAALLCGLSALESHVDAWRRGIFARRLDPYLARGRELIRHRFMMLESRPAPPPEPDLVRDTLEERWGSAGGEVLPGWLARHPWAEGMRLRVRTATPGLSLASIGAASPLRDGAVEITDVLYHVVNARHLKRRSMVFTTNKSLGQWGRVLHDDDLAEAIVDRILERGRLIRLDGPSQRSGSGTDQLDELHCEPARISGIDRPEFPEPTQRSAATRCASRKQLSAKRVPR